MKKGKRDKTIYFKVSLGKSKFLPGFAIYKERLSIDGYKIGEGLFAVDIRWEQMYNFGGEDTNANLRVIRENRLSCCAMIVKKPLLKEETRGI